MKNGDFLLTNDDFIIETEEAETGLAGHAVHSKQLVIFNTKFIILNTKLIVFDKKFIILSLIAYIIIILIPRVSVFLHFHSLFPAAFVLILRNFTNFTNFPAIQALPPGASGLAAR